uniref:Xyloglucan galactosyltransferase KATAMARI1 n=1 Tax=Anthurium amnicola TaxID=1678845 RepID=A0A1D1XQF3_9ARAE
MAPKVRYSPKEKVLHAIPASFLSHAKFGFYFFLFFSSWFLLVFTCFPSLARGGGPPPSQSTARADGDQFSAAGAVGTCPEGIARFYVYELPPEFNHALLHRCRTLNIYTDMCPHVANRGLGQPIPRPPDDPLRRLHGSWYATHQFIAEMIFHARAERHPCRTRDPLAAELFYVPFYGGLHASSNFRQPDLVERDRLAVELADYLVAQPAWRRRAGGDHFLALGRTAWDFMRNDAGEGSADFGANRLLRLPAVANMSVLTVERQPWKGRNQFGIPYPSYFHPRAAAEVAAWQDVVRRSRRTHLFAFVGGPRKGLGKAAVRETILRQCGASRRCRRVECEAGSRRCHDPDRVVEAMMGSEFCMQPPGDSFTRRSVFDAVLAGCVPVFFSEHTAYTQYGWYLPAGAEQYSVFLKGEERWGRIEAELEKIPPEEVVRLRHRVVELIPSLTYAHPNASHLAFRDAVDVALARLTQGVRRRHRLVTEE